VVKGWIAYGVAWLVAALLWTLASVNAGGDPLTMFPYGVLIMSTAAVMGVGVWRLTARLPLDWRSPSFYFVHAIALAIYALIYSTVWIAPDIARGRITEGVAAIRSSPVVMWNILMGGGLYLTVCSFSYAIRAQWRARADEADAAEARMLAQQAQLTALRAQLNPHFLFNALHSVGALVSHDPARADKAIEALGDLLRYTLRADDQVLFSQEWRFTQDYLSFEQLRLGDRLRIDATAVAPAMMVPVPPLILQPLVENAVRHGIADREEGGRIELRADVQGDRLVLRVGDDGNGNGNGAGSGDGLGLALLRQRLHALYGDAASLQIDRGASGFSVTLGVPLVAPSITRVRT
jgi:two-component system, LytTR family, sensor kinase